MPCPRWIRVRVTAPKIRLRHRIANATRRRPEPSFENFDRIWAGHSMHRVEYDSEPAGQVRLDGIKIEERFHQIGVIADWIDNIDLHPRQSGRAKRVDVDVLRLDDVVAGDFPCRRKNPIGQILGRWSTIRSVEFHAEILVDPTRIMARRQDQPSVRAARPDKVRRRWRRQDRALPDDDFLGTGSGSHTQDNLRRTIVEKPPVAAQHERLTLDPAQCVPDRLDEILEIMPAHEHPGLLPQA